MKFTVAAPGNLGVIKDVPPHRLPPEGWSDSTGFRFPVEGPSTLRGRKEVFTSAPIQPLWLSPFPSLTDPLWVYASNSDVYSYLGSAGTHLSLGTGFAAAGERWQGFVFQGVGILNQVNNHPQQLAPISHGTALANLSNWGSNPAGASTRVRSLRPYRNFLIAMYLVESGTDKPFRVRWSDAANPGSVPGSWAPLASNRSGEIDLAETPDYVVDGLVLGDVFIIYKERSAWGLQFVGGTQVMRSWRIADEVGILARDCVARFPAGHLVATQDDIYAHTGAPGSAQSILRDKLRRWLQRNINSDQFRNCFMCQNVPRKEIWFFFPSSGATYANRVLMWNWEENKIGILEVEETPFAVAGSLRPGSSTDTWASGS